MRLGLLMDLLIDFIKAGERRVTGVVKLVQGTTMDRDDEGVRAR